MLQATCQTPPTRSQETLTPGNKSSLPTETFYAPSGGQSTPSAIANLSLVEEIVKNPTTSPVATASPNLLGPRKGIPKGEWRREFRGKRSDKVREQPVPRALRPRCTRSRLESIFHSSQCQNPVPTRAKGAVRKERRYDRTSSIPTATCRGERARPHRRSAPQCRNQGNSRSRSDQSRRKTGANSSMRCGNDGAPRATPRRASAPPQIGPDQTSRRGRGWGETSVREIANGCSTTRTTCPPLTIAPRTCPLSCTTCINSQAKRTLETP